MVVASCCCQSLALQAETVIKIEPSMVHVRQTGEREWSEFSEGPDASEFRGHFFLEKTLPAPGVISFEQQDVKQTWVVSINGDSLGRLVRDENAMRVTYEVQPDQLTRGLNELRVHASSDTPDDIRIGRAFLILKTKEDYLTQRKLSVKVTESGEPVPSRITIINEQGALQTTGLVSSDKHAVRTGVVYTADGEAEIGLPSGKYTVIASRGPEYEIDQQEVDLNEESSGFLEFSLSRTVSTSGWVACDTHVHTLTHSGHGDSTEDERIITIAGEGIELPIITEHNKQINYSKRQAELEMSSWYTLVTGNEVTTKWGHFNIWPVKPGETVPKYKGSEWNTIFNDINAVSPEIVILNHAEDLHSGYRPFGRENRHRLTGRHLDGWELEANAMEVVNSGAQQSDMMQLPRDWMVCLNRGQYLTPVGCSDSHDVARHFIGQGRTYIQADDSHPGMIDVEQAVKSFREGRVVVSCGLIPMVTVEEIYGPGDLVPENLDNTLSLQLDISTPNWIKCDQYQVYMNGELVPSVSSLAESGGEIQNVKLSIPVPDHDVHLEVAVFGPGVTSLHWPIAKPYQPDSPHWESKVFGITGPIWYDGNGDGKRNSAREIAVKLWEQAKHKTQAAIVLLKEYDRAVALQLAELVHTSGQSMQSAEFRQFLKQQPDHVELAFLDYWDEWRMSEIARIEKNGNTFPSRY